MKGFLLDTNILSELRKQDRCDPGVRSWFVQCPENQLYVSVLVLGEIRLGGRRLQRYVDITAEFTERARVFWRARSQEWSPETRPYRHVADVLTQIGHFPPLRGNSIEFVAGSQPFIDGLIRDIDAARAATIDIADAFDRVLVTIEVCDTRLADANAAPLWKLADSLSNAGLVVSAEGVAPNAVHYAALHCEVQVDGGVAFDGTGTHPLRDPRVLLPWSVVARTRMSKAASASKLPPAAPTKPSAPVAASSVNSALSAPPACRQPWLR